MIIFWTWRWSWLKRSYLSPAILNSKLILWRRLNNSHFQSNLISIELVRVLFVWFLIITLSKTFSYCTWLARRTLKRASNNVPTLYRTMFRSPLNDSLWLFFLFLKFSFLRDSTNCYCSRVNKKIQMTKEVRNLIWLFKKTNDNKPTSIVMTYSLIIIQHF